MSLSVICIYRVLVICYIWFRYLSCLLFVYNSLVIKLIYCGRCDEAFTDFLSDKCSIIIYLSSCNAVVGCMHACVYVGVGVSVCSAVKKVCLALNFLEFLPLDTIKKRILYEIYLL